ncbi:uncharacterized protein LOC130961823 [Arachis stenosperma]|uniref:uncharacterized protein LOC130961823 n=1 Tax=Arachis stenosperma TaxID=217475 RepID=UPI0025AC09EC|nr:uncharacterized protein LOC130961823 [Arachis stenosperma]
MKLVWYCIQSELNTSLFCHHGRCSGCSRGDHAPWLSLSILTLKIMAYRRKQAGLSRASTFKEEFHLQQQPLDSSLENNGIATTNMNDASRHLRSSATLSSSFSFTPTSSTSSLAAAQAIKASLRDPSSLSFSSTKSSFAAPEHHRSKSYDISGDALGRGDPKSGFWGVVAQKGKDILDDNDKLRLQSFNNNTFAPAARPYQEGKTGELRSQLIKANVNGSFPDREDSNKDTGTWNPWPQQSGGPTSNPTAIHETQLKASRDVAMATAAKAKLLLRELKTVKADLAFAKARCAQLEEENKLLRDREGREKGQNRADDDLIRLQLETLLAEKARLANENETCCRENRFLREIVEYHQLSMQDVVSLDDDDEEGMDEVTELYPIDTNGMLSIFRGPQEKKEEQDHEDKKVSKDDHNEVSPSISASVDEQAKK